MAGTAKTLMIVWIIVVAVAIDMIHRVGRCDFAVLSTLTTQRFPCQLSRSHLAPGGRVGGIETFLGALLC